MSKKEKIWFNWHCPHCEHRNRVTFPFQFEVPKFYTAEWDCDHCGQISKVEFSFQVAKMYKKEIAIEKKDKGTKKDRGY